MSYKLINQEFNLWSCITSDLTIEHINWFKKLNNSESNIKTLPIIYECCSDRIILNKDNECFNKYVKITESYFELTKDQKKYFKEVANDYFTNIELRDKLIKFANILDQIIFDREIRRINYILDQQYVPFDKLDILLNISKDIKKNEKLGAIINAYNYGRIEGIREERVKRRCS